MSTSGQWMHRRHTQLMKGNWEPSRSMKRNCSGYLENYSNTPWENLICCCLGVSKTGCSTITVKNGVELFFSPIKRCQNKHPVLQLFPLLWWRGRTDSTFGRQMSYVEEEGGVYEAWYKLYTKWRSPFTTSHWALWVSKWATVGESWMGLMFRHRHS